MHMSLYIQNHPLHKILYIFQNPYWVMIFSLQLCDSVTEHKNIKLLKSIYLSIWGFIYLSISVYIYAYEYIIRLAHGYNFLFEIFLHVWKYLNTTLLYSLGFCSIPVKIKFSLLFSLGVSNANTLLFRFTL